MTARLFAGEDRWGDWHYTPGSTSADWGHIPPYKIDDNGEPVWPRIEGIPCTRPWSESKSAEEQINRDNFWSVYAIVNDEGEILYVGFTGHVKTRWQAHKGSRRFRGMSVEMVVLERHLYKNDAHEAEKRLIRELDPPFNVHHRWVA